MVTILAPTVLNLIRTTRNLVQWRGFSVHSSKSAMRDLNGQKSVNCARLIKTFICRNIGNCILCWQLHTCFKLPSFEIEFLDSIMHAHILVDSFVRFRFCWYLAFVSLFFHSFVLAHPFSFSLCIESPHHEMIDLYVYKYLTLEWIWIIMKLYLWWWPYSLCSQ